MLHVLLLILKTAGIIFAVLFGIIIVLLALVLFAPISYTLEARYYDKAEVKFKAAWLLNIFRFSAMYDEKLKMKLKILLFSLYDSEKQKKELYSEKKAEKSSKIEKKHTVFDEAGTDKEVVREKFSDDEISEDGFLKNEISKDVSCEDGLHDKLTYEKISGRENSETEQLKHTKNKRKNKYFKIFGKIKDTVKDIIDKSISLKNNVKGKKDAFTELIQDEENRELVRFLWENLCKLVKKIRPKKYRVYVRYGFEDSETTGWLAVRLAVIYGLLGLDVELIPDFEQSVFKGEVMLKGKICLFGIVVIAGRVYFNRLVQKKLLKK